MENEPELPLPAALALAQTWARSLQKETRTGELVDDHGLRVPLLLVTHGSRDVMVRSQGDCIIVFLLVDLSPEAKARWASLPPARQRKALHGLRLHLLAQPRSSFSIAPRDARSIADVNRVAVEQLIRISTEDPSSFNRYADAIQEVVSATVRAFSAIGALLDNDAGTGNRHGDDGPPTGMYA